MQNRTVRRSSKDSKTDKNNDKNKSSFMEMKLGGIAMYVCVGSVTKKFTYIRSVTYTNTAKMAKTEHVGDFLRKKCKELEHQK